MFRLWNFEFQQIVAWLNENTMKETKIFLDFILFYDWFWSRFYKILTVPTYCGGHPHILTSLYYFHSSIYFHFLAPTFKLSNFKEPFAL